MSMLPNHLLTRVLDPTIEVYGQDIELAFVRVIESLCATNKMLRALFLSEPDMTMQHAEGIYALIDQQCCMLTGIYIANEDRKAREAKERREKAASQLSDAVLKLRNEFIASGARAGAKAEAIGEAMNIPAEEIAAVLIRLRGEAGPHTAAQGERSVTPRRASAQA